MSLAKYAPVGVLVVMCLIIAYIYCKDGFASPDSVVARRSQRQMRTDPQFDSWDTDKLEACVKSINDRA